MADLRTNLQIPKNTSVVDDKGLMTLEWQKYFKELQEAVTGALEALETQYLNFSHAGDVRGASVLSTTNAVPLVGIPGVLLQGPVGEASVVITYVSNVTGAGIVVTTKTVTFQNGIETAHT
jgi:hypothetical protein